MPADILIEERLSAVEEAINQIRQRLAEISPTSDWIERFTGTFKAEPAFDELTAYGRAARSEDVSDVGDES